LILTAGRFVPDERHRRGQRGITFRRLADDADPDLRVPQVPGRLDRRYRGEPDARVGHVTGHDRPDLLPQQLIHALGPLAHRPITTLSGVRAPTDINPQKRG
jgi:hypothetical protein